jgi:hypothetical protein
LASNQEERPNGDVINAINSLVTVDIQTGSETVLDAGYDFYASPALSADGSKLAWLSWRHPNMPWTATRLSAAEFDPGGGLTNERRVAGSDPESIFQPQWSPAGRLYFISDRTDFWDSGGAPCVQKGLLSLAICKPMIRSSARCGDFILGFAANSLRPSDNRLIYAARVTRKLCNGEYYKDRKTATTLGGAIAFTDFAQTDLCGGGALSITDQRTLFTILAIILNIPGLMCS